MKPYSQQRRRYSHYTTDPVTGMPIVIATNEDGSVYTGNGGSSAGSGSASTWNWGYLTQIVNSLGNVASNIWGNGSNYQASAYQNMYNQQKQTNTILWVVIGLVLALGVVLIVRKTK